MAKVIATSLQGIFDRVLALSKNKEKVKPYVEMKDEELAKAVQKGEEMAYQVLIQRYQGKIYSYINRFVHNSDEALDVTQEVFLKAYRHFHSFDAERKFSSWLYRIAHNESVNYLKKISKARTESIDAQAESGIQYADKIDLATDYVREQDRIAVRLAIDKLPVKYRQVMEMRYLKQYSYTEISNMLGKPLNTIGTLINRAKKMLAQELLE